MYVCQMFACMYGCIFLLLPLHYLIYMNWILCHPRLSRQLTWRARRMEFIWCMCHSRLCLSWEIWGDFNWCWHSWYVSQIRTITSRGSCFICFTPDNHFYFYFDLICLFPTVVHICLYLCACVCVCVWACVLVSALFSFNWKHDNDYQWIRLYYQESSYHIMSCHILLHSNIFD